MEPPGPAHDLASFDAAECVEPVQRPTCKGMSYHFDLSNGQRLALARFGDGLRVSYGDRPAIVLRPDGSGNFVSRDRSLALRIQPGPDGEPAGLGMEAPDGWF